MKARGTCARCHRERHTDRMQPGVYAGLPAWLCAARASCKTARKDRRPGH